MPISQNYISFNAISKQQSIDIVMKKKSHNFNLYPVHPLEQHILIINNNCNIFAFLKIIINNSL